jgi:hypothetical protein
MFCRHNYKLDVLVGLGFSKPKPGFADCKDGAEIKCYCTKCNKIFINSTFNSNGTDIKEEILPNSA